MASCVFQLIYMSQAVEGVSYKDLHDILETSRSNNLKKGITGLLIYREGFFFQILEGNEENVRNTVSKIRLDDRNESLRILTETTNDQRLFGDWSMAFYDGDISANETAPLVKIFESCTQGESPQPSFIIPMLRELRDSAPSFK